MQTINVRCLLHEIPHDLQAVVQEVDFPHFSLQHQKILLILLCVVIGGGGHDDDPASVPVYVDSMLFGVVVGEGAKFAVRRGEIIG